MFIVTFVGLTYIYHAAIQQPLLSIVGGGSGSRTMWGNLRIMVLFEQIIAYITANIGIILHNNMVDDEGVDDGQI